MTQLLGMFQNKEGQKEFVIDNQVEVQDWGNVEAIRAGIRDPKKIQEYMENLKKGRPQATGPASVPEEKKIDQEPQKPV